MIWGENIVLGGGRHFGYRHGDMMILRHELVIRQFYIDDVIGSGFGGIVNRRCQWPGVVRTPTINGRVIMS